jgi:alanine racemase
MVSPEPVHLKFDTGMARFGHPWQRARAYYERMARLPNLKIEGISSHLATTKQDGPATLRAQISRFRSVLEQIPPGERAGLRAHLANSAATLDVAPSHFDMVRVGLALYGIRPSRGSSTPPLVSVLRLRARITQVRRVPRGTGVSYGHHHVTKREALLAVVGIGYGDGVPRGLSGKIHVLVRGQPFRQVGAITMDQLVIDATPLPDLRPGEIATLLGHDGKRSIDPEAWARALGTIVWEIVSGLQVRLPRVVVESDSSAMERRGVVTAARRYALYNSSAE